MNAVKVGAKINYAVCPCKSGKFITITSYHVGWAGQVKSKTVRFFASPVIKKRRQKRIFRELRKLLANIDDTSAPLSPKEQSKVVAFPTKKKSPERSTNQHFRRFRVGACINNA